ncbi:hypothetical protein [Asanoa siamensis]|uniref:hypothetical protein n=1 Tax=Asanoa siamensis TaxID=926357 RepID=UPI0019447C54|nr:hypothetical protein [Asanoa siamensis]
MEILFRFDGENGRVLLEVAADRDPSSVGKSAQDLGMPMCTASVEFRARGYRALLGWVLFEDSTAPFAWYGDRPVGC